MKQIATVKKVFSDGMAEIAVPRKSACGHDCSQCGGGCSELMVKSEVTARAANPIHAQPGDSVQVESESGQVLGIAAVVYLLPLFLFFMGYFAVGWLLQNETYAMAAGGVGFAAGIIAAVLVNRVVKRKKLTALCITAILD